VLIELFWLSVTAESLRAKRDRKSAISLQRGQFECLAIMSLTVFTQRNFVADFLQAKCDFRRKSAVLRFWAVFGGGLGATYDYHLRLIGKRVVDFLLTLIELFSIDVTA